MNCAPRLDAPRDPFAPYRALAAAMGPRKPQCPLCAPRIDVPHDPLAAIKAIAAAAGMPIHFEPECPQCAPRIDVPRDPLAALKAIEAASKPGPYPEKHVLCQNHPDLVVHRRCGHLY
jgi:hypothetical protein